MEAPNTPVADRYEILHGTDVTEAELADVIALDQACFDSCYQVTALDDYQLFKSNPENGIIIRDKTTGRLVAYSMLLPVRDEMYRRIRSGTFVDTDFRPDMSFKYGQPGIYHLYFASVVIHPDHRGARMVLTLLDAMVKDFIDLTSRGIFFENMIADVVSRDGIKFCRLFGLTEVCRSNHDSFIYEVSALPPMLRVTTPTTRRLYDIYRAKFADEYGSEVDFLGERYLDELRKED